MAKKFDNNELKQKAECPKFFILDCCRGTHTDYKIGKCVVIDEDLSFRNLYFWYATCASYVSLETIDNGGYFVKQIFDELKAYTTNKTNKKCINCDMRICVELFFCDNQ